MTQGAFFFGFLFYSDCGFLITLSLATLATFECNTRARFWGSVWRTTKTLCNGYLLFSDSPANFRKARRSLNYRRHVESIHILAPWDRHSIRPLMLRQRSWHQGARA